MGVRVNYGYAPIGLSARYGILFIYACVHRHSHFKRMLFCSL